MVTVLINYVSIIVDTITPSVVMTISVIVTIPNSSWAMKVKIVVTQPPKVVVSTFSFNKQGLLLTFNPIVEFLTKL